MESVGRGLLAMGVLLVLLGGGFLLASKLGWTRLPGDILWRKGNFTFYAPIGLMIVVSILLTIALNLFSRR
jgi:Protein of unknown function (DUF2905)